MKPINCNHCGYYEIWKGENTEGFCMKSGRMLSPEIKRPEECPLDKRPREDADKKGFYLIKGGRYS